ncbi:hypothetical protein KDL45_07415 [bacterium]|nr:hypothetical protein [bacterium]MCB9476438.1 hypothetical protein [Deltaproteobacteria bacterium]MCB9478413.1 hypothetical protein [Deltaproteobacteria bacterium]
MVMRAWIRIALAIGLVMIFSALACDSNDDDQRLDRGSDARDTEDNDDEDDVIPVVDNDDFEDIVDDVFDFVDEQDLEDFEEAGFPINGGDDPPNVEGRYLMDALVVSYDRVGPVYDPDDPRSWEGVDIERTYMEFSNQGDDGSLKAEYITQSGTESGEGDGAFISGEGNCFTVYIDLSGRRDTGPGTCTWKGPQLVTGCLEAGGVSGWKWGFLIKDPTPSVDNACDNVLPDQSLRVIDETDGEAARVGDASDDDDDDDTSDDDDDDAKAASASGPVSRG